MHIIASPAFSNEKINPYNALLYRNIEILGQKVSEYTHKKVIFEQYDILHLHWPDGYIDHSNWFKAAQRILVLTTVILVSKIKKAKLVWTVHNINPHDAKHPRFSQWFLDRFATCCNGFIFLTKESEQTFFNQYQHIKTSQMNKKTAIIPHGHYKTSYPEAIDQSEAKDHFNIPKNKNVILFIGMIKPYKNCDGLIAEFIKAKLENTVLLIAGRVSAPGYQAKLLELAKDNDNILLNLNFIPDNEVHLFMSAADKVILPYKSILNSGALLLALSFNKPVIAPQLGAFIELQEELGSSWINTYEGELTKDALLVYCNHKDETSSHAICPLNKYDWDKIALQTVSFYSTL